MDWNTSDVAQKMKEQVNVSFVDNWVYDNYCKHCSNGTICPEIDDHHECGHHHHPRFYDSSDSSSDSSGMGLFPFGGLRFGIPDIFFGGRFHDYSDSSDSDDSDGW